MAQRSTHELERRANGWAARLLEHKSIFVLALAAIAMASGLAMASLGGESDSGITIERADTGSQAIEKGASKADAGSAKTKSTEALYVDIEGAVASPGVYRLDDGARISDAIEAAGGLLDSADVSTLNRAAKVADGQKIHVPAAGEETQVTSAEASGGTNTTASSSLVNINTATADELQTLSGVGPSTAQAIVEDRDAHGPFSSIEDLMRVSGIGEKKFEKLRSQVCV